MEGELQQEGWVLSEKGLECCKSMCTTKNPSKKDIIRNALHTDIREIGKQSLPTDINKGKFSEIQGPLVLQIQKIKNISAPNVKEDSSVAPRMLKVTMTDGVITCSGIELETVDAISLSTPPGSKVCLKGSLKVQHGFILLDSRSLKFLGGDVEHLRAKWEMSKNVSKIQRKILTAEGGPPLFAPFEDSDFVLRKPQGPAVAVKHAGANSKQKAKPPAHQTEKPSKQFEEKKIWKSDPSNGKQDKNSKTVGDKDLKEAGNGQQETRQNIVKGGHSKELDRRGSSKGLDGKVQKGGVKGSSDNKDVGHSKQSSKDVKRVGERGKGRGEGREEKGRSTDFSKSTKNTEPDEKFSSDRVRNRETLGRDNKEKGRNTKHRDDFRGKQQPKGDPHHSKFENSRQKSARQEENVNHAKTSLPPRLEKLKPHKDDDTEGTRQGESSRKEQQRTSVSSKGPKDRASDRHVDEDMKRVTELLNERMRLDSEKGKFTRSEKSSGPRDQSYLDRSNWNSRRNETRNVERNVPRDSHVTQQGRQKSYEKQRNLNERDSANRNRGFEGRERGYRGSQEHGSDRGDNRQKGRHSDRKYSNKPENSQQYQGGGDTPPQAARAGLTDGNNERNSNAFVGEIEEKGGGGHSNPGEYSSPVQLGSEAESFGDKGSSEKVNSVMYNNFMGGDYRLMNQQVLTDHQITHTTVQQPIMTSDGQFVYSYLPTYPTAVYHPNAQQSYQNAPNQEFQGAGYHRPGIHPMQPVSQYQQVGVPRVGQDFRYMQSAAQPNFPFQSQGMQPPIRPRSRIRHDVYRPKRS